MAAPLNLMHDPRHDPRQPPAFVVAVWGGTPAARASLQDALLEVPAARDEDVARLVFASGDEPADALLVIAASEGDAAARGLLAQIGAATPAFIALFQDEPVEPWPRGAGGAPAFAIGGLDSAQPSHGLEGLRAALLSAALEKLDLPVARALAQKRPYATAIIAGSAAMAGAEGFLPGAAAFVVSTQVGAIMSLHYLYTGRWLGRSQALTLVPVFASEAAGGSAFLLAKSLLPPTGIADAAAGAVAAGLTIAMLGAVAWALEQGYALDEKDKLLEAFRRMKAKTKAERAYLLRNRRRWGDRGFWRDLCRRIVFE